MQDEVLIEAEEPTYHTKYVELSSLDEYEAMNEEISNNPLKLAEWANTGTVRYAPENPMPVNGKYYMQISARMQELYPDRAAKMVLVDVIPSQNQQ